MQAGSPLATDLLASGAKGNSALPTDRPALVWFKQDLRLDDHPGLDQALASGASVVPLFCFDPALYSHLLRAPHGLEGLLGAVAALRVALRERGSNLLLRMGPAAAEVPAAAELVGANRIIAEEEVEHRWLAVVDGVTGALPSGISFMQWKASLFPHEPDSAASHGWNWRRFQQERGTPMPPLPPPAAGLPALPEAVLNQLPVGDLPTLTELRAAITAQALEGLPAEVASMATSTSESWPALARAPDELAAALAGGGEPAAQSALGAYLRCRRPAQGAGLGLGLGFERAVAEIRDEWAAAAARPATPAGRASLGHLAGTSSSWQSWDENDFMGPRSVTASAAASWDGFDLDVPRAAADAAASYDVQGTAAAAAPEPPPFSPASSSAGASQIQQQSWSCESWEETALWAAEQLCHELIAAGEAAEAGKVQSHDTETHEKEGEEELQRLMREALERHETAATPLGSFPAVFAPQLALGTLSRRRVYAAAQKASGSGGLPFGLSGAATLPARAAAAAAEAADFHWHLARFDRARDTRSGCAPRHWRWRGVLTDYITAEPAACGPGGQEGAADRRGAPAVLLVHGFGAFGEQFRGQVQALARAGLHVYAPTFPGYGRSEKPALAYSQELWRDFLRDFVVEVVRRRVVAVGNSIGGYISASLAGDYPTLVQGLVLVNSAGRLDPGYIAAEPDPSLNPDPEPASGPPRFVVDLLSRVLFLYLERSVASTLVKIYPAAPQNADAWLAEEIQRAACDPGALGVFRSVFYLPKPRPLNYLVAERFAGPALVLQGARDPLNDAVQRAKDIAAACPNVRVKLLDGGHCPHDEVPEAFNSALLEFMEEWVPTRSADLATAA